MNEDFVDMVLFFTLGYCKLNLGPAPPPHHPELHTHPLLYSLVPFGQGQAAEVLPKQNCTLGQQEKRVCLMIWSRGSGAAF